MASEYDPVVPDRPAVGGDDLERVQDLFVVAGRPYLSSHWPWLAWALLLPAAALATPAAAGIGGAAGVMALWSLAILVGGLFEAGSHLRRRRRGASPLAAWVLRTQGNLSLVAVALSLLVLWLDRPETLPGLWLVLLGHSLYSLGGLAFPPQRRVGLLYQLGGLVALWPHGRGLEVLAVTTAVANLLMAWELWREGRRADAG